jgi:hypothetical protein
MATQDPFAADVAYASQTAPQAAPMRRGDTYTRPEDSAQFSVVDRAPVDESPTQLLNMGYTQDANGTWVKYREPEAPASGEDPFAADMQATARDTAMNAGFAANPLGRQMAFQNAALEQAPFGDELQAAFGSLFTGESYSDMRDLQAKQARFDRENYGGQRNLGGAAGFTAGLTVPVGSGYVQGARGLAQIGRGAALGAGTGALYGFGAGDGSAVDRLPGAVQGATVGGITGGALTGGTQYASRLLGISSTGTRPPNIDRAEGRAAQRLVASIEDRPAAVTEYQRLNALGLQPSVMDVGGGTTERLVRTAAGPAGPAANAAVENYVARAAQLKPEIIASTRRLSPVQETAEQYAETLGTRQDRLAAVEYPGPYAAPVELTDEAIRALRGPRGQAAIDRAIETEQSFPDYNPDLIAELQSLKVADLNARPTVTGRALDSVRRNLRDMSTNAMRGDDPNRSLGAAMAQRVEGVDTALDTAPGLTEARATFRNLAQQIESLEPGAVNIFQDPADFARRLEVVPPESRQAFIDAAMVRVRQDITDQLGRQRDAGTGSIDNLRQSQWSQQNLAALLGPERARQYLDEITARVQQVQRLGRTSPNTNSQTFGRMADEQTMGTADAMSAIVDGSQILSGNMMAAGRAADRVRNLFARAGMSPEERLAIVNMGQGSAYELDRIVALAADFRRQGRTRLPREVINYINRIETTVGGQTAARFEAALLNSPSQVLAEQEQQ